MKNKSILLISIIAIISLNAVTLVSADPIMKYRNTKYTGFCNMNNCDNNCPNFENCTYNCPQLKLNNTTLGNNCPNFENCTYNYNQRNLRMNTTISPDCINNYDESCDQKGYRFFRMSCSNNFKR